MDRQAARARWAVAAMFGANGFVMGAWAPQIPLLLPRHDITESVLGLLILVLGIGAVGAMLFAGRLITRFGSAPVLRAFSISVIPVLPIVVFAPNLWVLTPAMALFGAMAGCMDVAMNAQAVQIERRLHRAIMSSSHGFWSLGGFVGGAAGAFVLAPHPERVEPSRDPFVLFPRDLAGWTGAVGTLEPDIERVLGADDYITATYAAAGESGYVNLFVAYYDSLTEGEGLHSPEVCLPSGGWEVFSIDPHEVSLPGTVYGTFNVNRAVIQKGLSKQVVYYWFEQRGKRMTNDYLAKASVVWDSLTLGRADGALVRFVTAINPGETEADADARIARFMAEALQDMPRFVPE